MPLEYENIPAVQFGCDAAEGHEGIEASDGCYSSSDWEQTVGELVIAARAEDWLVIEMDGVNNEYFTLCPECRKDAEKYWRAQYGDKPMPVDPDESEEVSTTKVPVPKGWDSVESNLTPEHQACIDEIEKIVEEVKHDESGEQSEI